MKSVDYDKEIPIDFKLEEDAKSNKDPEATQGFEKNSLKVADKEATLHKLKLRGAELESELQNIARQKADTALRDKYSFKAFKVVKKSLWGWAILLSIYGVIKFLTRNENNGQGFEVFSDNVLITITTATTLNIFAAFLSLIRGLFPSINKRPKQSNKKRKS